MVGDCLDNYTIFNSIYEFSNLNEFEFSPLSFKISLSVIAVTPFETQKFKN